MTDGGLATEGRAPLVGQRLALEESALYAVLDAARDDLVLAWINTSGVEALCLYDGWQSKELADVAPYLVSVPRGSEHLRALLDEAWGRNWGVFLTSGVGMRELRRHLRRFLKVSVEGRGRMLFRFYDPRVLRAFLPTCTVEEANAFFGPIDAFVTEGHAGESVMRFCVTPDGVATETEALPDATVT
ncbi:MAG: DUF4123 domain-containing protein [Polyangiales bacterium]